MNFEDISKTIQFKELLEKIPESERAKVEEALKKMASDFEEKVIRPLSTLIKR